MQMVILLSILLILESKDIKKAVSRPLIFRVIFLKLEIISGRALRLCGAMGVSTKLLDSGIITGPPQLNEYPVEPVGVATIRPSAQ